jgi:hypothetical protein
MTPVMSALGDSAYLASHERGQYEQSVAQAVRSSDQLDRAAAFNRASSPFQFALRTPSGRPRGGTALRVGTVAPDRFASGHRAPTAFSKQKAESRKQECFAAFGFLLFISVQSQPPAARVLISAFCFLLSAFRLPLCHPSHPPVTPCTGRCQHRSDDAYAHIVM